MIRAKKVVDNARLSDYKTQRSLKTNIYIIECDGFMKVGLSVKPERRYKQIQTNCPHEVFLRHAEEIFVYGSEGVEKAAHKILEEHHVRREWYSCPLQEAIEAVKKAISEHDTDGDVMVRQTFPMSAY